MIPIFRKYILLLLMMTSALVVSGQERIDLSGTWLFQTDPLDIGVTHQWFNSRLNDQIRLPGSMTTNGKGDDITVNTPWTGSIQDSSWFVKPEYAKYRQPGNIKIPFWLQPVKYYKGAAWYQKTITVPASWLNSYTELYIERCHWESTVWVDGAEIGRQNSLGTAHSYKLPKKLSPGRHTLTVRIDNRIKDINVGQNSHSITDHTQGNWNGMIGKIYLKKLPPVYMDDIQLYPDIHKKLVLAKLTVINNGSSVNAAISLSAASQDSAGQKIAPLSRKVKLKTGLNELQIIYPMGSQPLLWDEFHPHLYRLTTGLSIGKNKRDSQTTGFGMREFSARGTQFTINGRLTFLRGTLECAIFPLTGYPPTTIDAWLRIFKICRHYGLNHLRFHSWCPPEVAFEAADRSGFYLQIECCSWANDGASIGDGKPLDQYIYDESNRIVKAYGNHPSFCMMLYGNEPAGDHQVAYLTGFVKYWKARDTRRLYTTGAGWPIIPESDYNSTPDPRIQAWGEGLKSIINSKPPKSDYDWRNIIAKWQHPTVSHEIGQWCAYPDFKEIKQYTGVMKPKNFEIFRETLRDHGMLSLADSFLYASGRSQVMCYKADIEAALRTPGFGGFQLLDLHDFPGQGTALVGVLNPFWREKGYVTGREYSQFCNAIVPLARLSKHVYTNNEQLVVPIEIANFGAGLITGALPSWNISNTSGEVLFNGKLAKTDIPLGNGIKLGTITQALSSITQPSQLKLTVSVASHQNSWDIFVYPATLPVVGKDILVTQQLDAKAIQKLNEGGKVLLTIKKGSLRAEKGGNVAIGFSTIFWNTAWTNSQPPVTMGILCNPAHPALKYFPTQYHINWQWWDAMSHSNAIRLDEVSPDIKPIVRVIDDWVTARPLGLLFECKVGKGKLMVSGIDLIDTTNERPEARQLLFSIENYMSGSGFDPKVEVGAERIQALLNPN